MARSKVTTFRHGRVSGRVRGQWWQLRFTIGGQRYEEHVNTRSITRARERAVEIDNILVHGNEEDLRTLREGERTTLAELIEEFNEKYTRWAETTRQGVCGIETGIKAE